MNKDGSLVLPDGCCAKHPVFAAFCLLIPVFSRMGYLEHQSEMTSILRARSHDAVAIFQNLFLLVSDINKCPVIKK